MQENHIELLDSINISNCLKLIQTILNFIQAARDSDETIGDWVEKAKSFQSEIHFEPTAIDSFATQNRPNRFPYTVYWMWLRQSSRNVSNISKSYVVISNFRSIDIPKKFHSREIARNT